MAKYANRTRFALLALFALMAAAHAAGRAIPRQLERLLQDSATRRLLPRPTLDSRVVVVEIDDRSLAEMGQRWPIDRDTWSRFIDRASNLGANVIALDVVFDQPDRHPERELAERILARLPAADESTRAFVQRQLVELDGDRHLSESIAKAGNVVLGTMLVPQRSDFVSSEQTPLSQPLGVRGGALAYRQRQLTESEAQIQVSALSSGTLNVLIDSDGRLRRYVYAGAAGERAYPSLALAAVSAALPARANELAALALGSDDGAPLLRHIDTRTIPRLSFSDVLNASAAANAPGLRDALTGKIVFVGVTATGVPEQLVTPLGTDSMGVQIHAIAASNLLQNGLLRSRGAPAGVGLIATLLVLGALTFAGQRLPMPSVATAAFLLYLAYIAGFYASFAYWGWVLPLAPVTAGCVGLLAAEAAIRARRLTEERRSLVASKHLADEKEAFIATVTHELRTPLTSIRGSLGLLAGGAAGELEARSAEMVKIAYGNTERLIGLVNDVLDLEKLGAGRMQLDVQSGLAVKELLAATAADNVGFADEHGVALSVACEPEIQIDGDRSRLVQVITNLLANAVSHSPTDATVALRAKALRGGIQIDVSDTGPGIPEEFQPHVFERFARAPGNSRSGTGLGLSIARSLVEQHGGRIWFDTSTRGTTFHVFLPQRNQESSPDDAAPKSSRSSASDSSGHG